MVFSPFFRSERWNEEGFGRLGAEAITATRAGACESSAWRRAGCGDRKVTHGHGRRPWSPRRFRRPQLGKKSGQGWGIQTGNYKNVQWSYLTSIVNPLMVTATNSGGHHQQAWDGRKEVDLPQTIIPIQGRLHVQVHLHQCISACTVAIFRVSKVV